MRELKFRIFHKPTRTMQMVAEISFVNETVSTFGSKLYPEPIYNIPLSECEVMQYIGRQDKNGVDIYEGDTLKDYDGRKYSIDSELYESCGCCSTIYGWEMGGRFEQDEIVGNIYEKSEGEEKLCHVLV